MFDDDVCNIYIAMVHDVTKLIIIYKKKIYIILFFWSVVYIILNLL